MVMKHTIVAFASPLIARRLSLPTSLAPSSTSVQSFGSTTTCLQAMSPKIMVDHTAAAVTFFTSVRVPSALIAGASLSSLFSLVNLVDDTVKGDRKQAQSFLVRLYHALCLSSLILSLNVIVSSTCAATTLLLEDHDGLARSAYEFMLRECEYEFVTTRWSFLTCLLSFIGSIATRSILEFDLLRRGRRRLGLVVVFSMSSLMAHMLSYVNSTLHHWGSLVDMTVYVFRLVTANALSKPRMPLEVMSLCFGVAAIVVAMPMLKLNFKSEDSQFDEADEDDDDATMVNNSQLDVDVQEDFSSDGGGVDVID